MRDKVIFISVSVVAVVVGVLVFMYGSKNVQSPQSSAAQQAIVVPFTELVRGAQSKVSTRVNYRITSAAELEEVWDLINATSTPPAIDFSTHAVLAVFAGKKPTAGYSIAVREVKDAENRMVTISLLNPGEGCMLAQSVSAPYALAVVPVTALPLAHEDIVAAMSCK